jgi:hypothetical protein
LHAGLLALGDHLVDLFELLFDRIGIAGGGAGFELGR